MSGPTATRELDLIGLAISLATIGSAVFWLLTEPYTPAWRVFGGITGTLNLASAGRYWWRLL